MFILDEAGLNAGVGSEVGAILDEFDLRIRNREPTGKPRRRFRIHLSDEFGSVSIEEIPSGYDIDVYRYQSEADLLRNLRNFVTNVEGLSRYDELELYEPPKK